MFFSESFFTLDSMSELIDMHLHLLPGIDDSHLKTDEMDAMFSAYSLLGFKYIFFTPHLYNPYVITDIKGIGPMFEKAGRIAEKYGIITSLASEVYIREYDEYRILPLSGRYVLCEFSTTMPPLNLFEKLDRLIDRGFRIIFAHIERYNWFAPDNEYFKMAKKRDILFQVNATEPLCKKSIEYLDSGIVDFIASDNHGDIEKPEILLKVLNQYPKIIDKMYEHLINVGG